MRSFYDRPGELALHPIAIAAMAVTWCNDHYMKQLWPGWFTGKLSDISGLAFFPFWAAAALELCLFTMRRRWLVGLRCMLAIVACAATLFTAIKISPSANRVYEELITDIRGAQSGYGAGRCRAHNRVDPTDLIALPALGI